MTDPLLRDPENYAEALAWFNECKARRARDREKRTALESELAQANENHRQAMIAVGEMEADLAARWGENRLLDEARESANAATFRAEDELAALKESSQKWGKLMNEQMDELTAAKRIIRKQQTELAALKGMLRHHYEESDDHGHVRGFDGWQSDLRNRWEARP